MERETAFLSANTPLNMRAPAFLALLFRPETRCCCGKDRFLFRERPSRLGTPAKLPRDPYLRCHGRFQLCFRSSTSFTSFYSSKTMLVDCSIKQTEDNRKESFSNLHLFLWKKVLMYVHITIQFSLKVA